MKCLSAFVELRSRNHSSHLPSTDIDGRNPIGEVCAMKHRIVALAVLDETSADAIHISTIVQSPESAVE
jgi:hypothetical protein